MSTSRDSPSILININGYEKAKTAIVRRSGRRQVSKQLEESATILKTANADCGPIPGK